MRSEKLSNSLIYWLSNICHLLINLFQKLTNHLDDRLNKLISVWKSSIKNIIPSMRNFCDLFMDLFFEIHSANVFTLDRLVPFVVETTEIRKNFDYISNQSWNFIDLLYISVTRIISYDRFINIESFSTNLDNVAPKVFF